MSPCFYNEKLYYLGTSTNVTRPNETCCSQKMFFLFLFETLASTVKIESVTMVKTMSTQARSANFKGGTHEVYKVRTSTSLTFKNAVSKRCVAT